MHTRRALGILAAGLACAALAAPITLAPGSAQVATRSAPRALKVSELGLREAGLTASPFFLQADEIRVFASADRTNESPQARIWVHAGQTNRYWFHTGGAGSAEDFIIPKGAAVAAVLRAATNEIRWESPFPAE